VRVPVVNAGSRSLKVDMVEDGETVESHYGLPAVAPNVDAVGHRIVHGGPDLVEPVVIMPTSSGGCAIWSTWRHWTSRSR
jgi:acetate kinase